MRFERVRAFLRRFYRYRSIRVTPEGTRFVLLTLAVGVAAINTGNNLLYLLLAMMLSLIIMSGLLSEQCLKQLDVRRRMPEHIFANRPATVSLTVVNRKHQLPTFSLRVMDVIDGTDVDRGIHLLHLAPRASAMHSYPILVPRRGLYRIPQIKLLTRFPFGLFIKAATFPLSSEAVIYPEIKPLPSSLVSELPGLGHDQPTPRRGPGVALYNLRPYRTGDDSRTIHWKTSARQSGLIVRETEAEDQRRVTLALPTTVPEEFHHMFERGVGLTASLASFFRERGYAVRALVGFVEIPYGVGEAHFHRVLRALGLCQPVAVSAQSKLPEGFRTLGERTMLGELTIAVLSWPDPKMTAACRGVSRVVLASEYS